jgi:3-methylcrotonyl-CoA carboxylase alpha subunit
MFARVLIANRGEIACRIARTAKRLGIYVIGVHSQADAQALHPRLCDESHLIGPPAAGQSYLAADRLIAIAKRTGAQCIHPGYGFLSENAEFANACVNAGLTFVGPPVQAIRTMGLKHEAKSLVEKRGVPIVPGYHGERQDPKFLKEKAYQIGYPVLIKAIAGGGGRGMRRVDKHAEFDAALESAIRESHSAFGDDRVLLEKYIANPRHIEIQVFGDQHGAVIHLFERDCTLQRRHQKVIEETPGLGVSAAIREVMGRAAVEVARAVGYVNAGTVEFIVEGTGPMRPDGFWFMEMNTRLQVEHAVTEAVTGLDLVEWQFRIAAGERLPLGQAAVPFSGHAIEARLYAEDPETGFLPSTGKLVALQFPMGNAGIRVDSGVEAGDHVTPYYDPMIAKVIAHAPTRTEAIERLATTLEQTLIAGPCTNAAFLVRLLRAPDFREGSFDTNFIDRNLTALGAVPQELDRGATARGVAELLARQEGLITQRSRAASDEIGSPWNVRDAFQFSTVRQLEIPISVNGEDLLAQVLYEPSGASVSIDGLAPAPDAVTFAEDATIHVLRAGRQTSVRLKDFDAIDVDHLDSDGVVLAPMHGKVLAILVEPGASVRRGERLAVIEAMKMEHVLNAPRDGTVSEILVTPGSQVGEGARVMVIAPA